MVDIMSALNMIFVPMNLLGLFFGVLVGIVIAVLTYLTNLYFKIREDNRRSRSRDEPDAEE